MKKPDLQPLVARLPDETERRVFAPGRVNLIGDHTDYMGGLVFPMAINRGVTLTGVVGGDNIEVRSGNEPTAALIELPVTDPASISPEWGRLVGGVAAEMRCQRGFRGFLESDLPVGGLSSSAAVAVATAIMLGHDGDPIEIASTCQAAEQRSTGVPCGIMDQLTSAAGVDGHALLIDCHTLKVTPVALPADVDVVIVHSGQHRQLAQSEYAIRRAQCEAAEALIGPLRATQLADAESIGDSVLRARARHVISENERVRQFAEALEAGSFADAGELMVRSHRSLAEDFEVSTPVLDSLIDELLETPGVFGARLTGAGFGGAVVALTEPASVQRGFVALPSRGARVI